MCECTQLFLHLSPFLPVSQRESSFCGIICCSICLTMGNPRPGGEGSLTFCHRLESCKLTPHPTSVTLLAVTLTALAFGLQCFCKNLPSLTPLAFSSEYILLCLRWLCLQWGFYWDQTLHPELGWALGGRQLGAERPFSHDLQACDHLICRLERWGAHMKSQGGAHKRSADAQPGRLKLLMWGRKPCGRLAEL